MNYLRCFLVLSISIWFINAPVWALSTGTEPAKPAGKFNEGKVAQTVAGLMEQAHFSQKPFDTSIARIFLQNYYEMLDSSRMVFLQTDLDEFNAKYIDQLNKLTRQADVTPCQEIFKRFVLRLEQWQPHIEELLKKKYDFTQDETFLLNRRKASWPKNEADALDLWRKRIKFELLQGRLQNDKEAETVSMLAKRYQRRLKETHELEPQEILQTYLTAFTNAYDPHSDYQSPDEAKNFKMQSITLSLTGIGAVLKSEDGYAKIVSLVPGGPADLDKRIKPNDRVISVKQEKGEPVNVVDMRLSKVVDMIRGERGTKVTLTLIPTDAGDSSARREVTLVRDVIRLEDQQAKAKIYEHALPNGTVEKLGVLTLPGFYGNDEGVSTTVDSYKLIKQMEQEKITGLIVDLRLNGGGLLDQALGFTSLFVNEGPVVQVKDTRGRITALKMPSGKKIYDGPLVVLTSHISASASEIVAAALQDYGRALIVGDKSTFGKATVQTLVDLKDMMGWGTDWEPGVLKITVQKFYRIAGGSTQLHGVLPDIVLPSLYDYMGIGESSYPNALPGDDIPAARFTKISGVASSLPELISRSQNRVQQSKDFGYYQDEIELLKKRTNELQISLQESKRRAEKTEAEARKDAIDKERALRKPTADKVYALDVKMVDAKQPPKLVRGPGAPAPKVDEKKSKDTVTDDDLIARPESLDIQLEEALQILRDTIQLPSKQREVIATAQSKN